MPDILDMLDTPGTPDTPGTGEPGTVYFKPSSSWKGDGITFFAYFWADGVDASWIVMSDSDSDGIYDATVPEGVNKVIFVTTSGPENWDNKVKQTADLDVPVGAKNTFVAHTNTWETLADARNIDESTPVELVWYLATGFFPSSKAFKSAPVESIPPEKQIIALPSNLLQIISSSLILLSETITVGVSTPFG